MNGPHRSSLALRPCTVWQVGGILSIMPETCWHAGLVANAGRAQLHSVVAIEAERPPGSARIGRVSCLRITACEDCRLAVLRCLRPLDATDRPTWRAARRRAADNWSLPGAGGPDDAELIATVSLSASRAAALTGDELVRALAPLAGGEPAWLILTRADREPNVVSVAVECDVQWLAGGDDV